ncbi:MAG: putative Ig domain-containing protein [Desulfitobacteriaceae bacterium]
MNKIKSSFLCCLFTGVLILMFSSIAFASNLTISEDRILTEDLTVDGDLDLSGAALNLDGHKLTVNGDVVMSGIEAPTLDIAGGTLNVTGSLIQQSGELKVNVGTINITGDYRIQTRSGSNGSYSYGTGGGWLTMQSPGGTVNIDGSFVTDSTTWGYLDAGTMNIKGNFTQKSTINSASPSNFNATEAHKVVLCGTGEQDISFEDPTESGFGMLDITNGTTRDIVFKTPVRGWALEQDLKIKGDLGLADGKMSLNEHHLTVTGDVVIDSGEFGVLDIAGGTLDVMGSLIQQAGELKLNSGTINIGVDFRVQSRNMSEGNYVYGTSNGWLTMKSPGGTINIDGSFVTDSTTWGYLDAGTMNIKGNFTQKSTINSASPSNFNATEAHKVVLCGTGEQDVSFEDPTKSGFGMLDITNGTTRDIVFKTPVRGWTLKQDLKIKGDLDLADKQMSLNEHHLTVTGDVVISSEAYEGALDIADGVLDVSGSLIQQVGELKVNSGSINIVRDYRVQSRSMSGGNYVYGTSNGWLTMKSPGGTINIDGNFFIDSTTWGNLEAGTMNVKENFTQKSSTSNASTNNFNASEGHKVVLCGTGEQIVSFDDPIESSFGTLVILRPIDKSTLKDRVKFLTNPSYKAIFYAPQLKAIGDKSVKPGSTLSFKLELLKTNDGQLTYSASNLPQGASFDASTATFTWKPTSTQVGTYPGVHFAVTDSNAGDSEDIKITVSDDQGTPEITGFEANPSSVDLITGKTKAVKVTVLYDDESKEDVTKSTLTTWESENTNVATVNGGVITGTGKGVTTVTAYYNDMSVKISVRVTPVIKSITADPTTIHMILGGEDAIPPVITAHYGGDDGDEDVTEFTTWKSTKTNIVEVVEGDDGETFQAKAKGTAKLTATFGNKTTTINVKVTPEITGFEAIPSTVVLTKGKKQAVKVYLDYVDGTKEDVTKSTSTTWESEETGIATFVGGSVFGVDIGETTVSAYYNEMRVDITVKVTPVIKSITADPTTIHMILGGEDAIPPVITALYGGDDGDEDVTDFTTWKSNKMDIVEVVKGDDGETSFQAKAKGTAKLTAKFGNKTTTINVKVTPEITGFEAIPSMVALTTGKKQAVKVYLDYVDGTKEDVTKLTSTTWESEETGIATFAGGSVFGVDIGETTVSAYYNEMRVDITVKVTPVVKSITADPADPIEMIIGDDVYPPTIMAQYNSDYDDEEVTEFTTWKSSKPTVLQVISGEDGVSFHAQAKGTSKLTATFCGKSISISVTVTE